LHIKINDVNQLSHTNPTLLVEIPPSQLPSIHPSNLKKMIFQCNVCKEIFSTHALSIDHVNTVHKSSNNKVEVKSNDKKSKTVRVDKKRDWERI
jgi:ribosomal protein L31